MTAIWLAKFINDSTQYLDILASTTLLEVLEDELNQSS